MTNLFITATDTDAGKTFVARALIVSFVNQGKKVAVYKPVAAGCRLINGELVNDDAKLLQQSGNCQQSIRQVNPIAFIEAIAPHIAAKKSKQPILLETLIDTYQQVKSLAADIIITEGAGGWRLPLGNGRYLSDFVKAVHCDVILVVNMKLGCLNHAMLTYETILTDGLNCVGWVANCQQEMPYLKENIEELSQLLPMPLIGRLPYCTDINEAAGRLNINNLI